MTPPRSPSERTYAPLEVGQVWALKTNGERWRIEQDRGNGEYLVRALDGSHEGKTDAVFGAEIRQVAVLAAGRHGQANAR